MLQWGLCEVLSMALCTKWFQNSLFKASSCSCHLCDFNRKHCILSFAVWMIRGLDWLRRTLSAEMTRFVICKLGKSKTYLEVVNVCLTFACSSLSLEVVNGCLTFACSSISSGEMSADIRFGKAKLFDVIACSDMDKFWRSWGTFAKRAWARRKMRYVDFTIVRF